MVPKSKPSGPSQSISNEIARFVASEFEPFRYVFAVRTSPTVPLDAQSFTYHQGGVLALIWIIAALSVVEVTLVHVVIRQWSHSTATLISVFSVLGVVYMIGIGNSLRCLPTFIDGKGVHVRLGLLINETIDWANVADVQPIVGEASPKTARILRAAAISTPNIRIKLAKPQAVRRLLKNASEVDAVELYLDDPKGFCSLVQMKQMQSP